MSRLTTSGETLANRANGVDIVVKEGLTTSALATAAACSMCCEKPHLGRVARSVRP